MCAHSEHRKAIQGAPKIRYSIRMADHRIPFAVGPDGTAASIKDVASGLACKCICPACEAKLVAKKGPKQTHHFAHDKGANCANALESSIHLAVKTIIERERQLLAPACIVLRRPDDSAPPMMWTDIPTVEPYYYVTQPHYDWASRVVAGVAGTPSPKLLEFDGVLVERQEGNIRPDLIGLLGDRKIYIEVAVTHLVDDLKLAKIRARGVATLEIRVPYEPDTEIDWDTLRALVVEQTASKHWLYHPIIEDRAEQHYTRLAPEREAARRREEARRLHAEQRAKQLEERQKRRAARKAANRAERMAARQAEIERQREASRAQDEARKQAMASRNNDAVRLTVQDQDEAYWVQARQRIADANSRYWEEIHAAQRAREAAWREQDEREQREREEREAQQRAEHAARLERLRTGTPSPQHPVDARAIYLDPELLQPGCVLALKQALGDGSCTLVISSPHEAPERLAELLAPLGGRHLGVTPTLDIADRALRRTRELVTWLDAHGSPTLLVLSRIPIGIWPGWTLHVIKTGRIAASDLSAIKRWLMFA